MSSKQNVDFFFDPILVVWSICVARSLIDQARKICQLVNKIKKLADVIGNAGDIWILPFQVLFKHFTYPFHAFVNAFVVGISSGLWFLARLNEKDRVAHCDSVVITENAKMKST